MRRSSATKATAIENAVQKVALWHLSLFKSVVQLTVVVGDGVVGDGDGDFIAEEFEGVKAP